MKVLSFFSIKDTKGLIALTFRFYQKTYTLEQKLLPQR